jgi:hypothetical protein
MTNFANTAIDAAAAAIADARLALDDADAALAPAVANRDVVAKRIVVLEAERASIVAARRDGNRDDATDGARIALIDVDTAELKTMLTEADAEVNPLRQATEEAKRRIAAAEMAMAGIREDEVLRLTMARADELSALLLQAIVSIESHKQRKATSRNLWDPSAALAEKVNKLHLTRI